jgi:hypothetical protein
MSATDAWQWVAICALVVMFLVHLKLTSDFAESVASFARTVRKVINGEKL